MALPSEAANEAMTATMLLRVLCALALIASAIGVWGGCGNISREGPGSRYAPPAGAAIPLSVAEVGAIMTQAVAQAQKVGANVVVAVSDREGRIRGVFQMAAASAGPTFPGTLPTCLPFPGFEPCAVLGDGVNCAIAKARTAAFFSSTGEAFSTKTAFFIIQPQFTPGIANSSGGPLYGVSNSSLPGSDVLTVNGIKPNGISGTAGGVPLFKGGFNVGGVGISGDLPSADESIALAAQRGFAPSPAIVADQILVNGIRLPYAGAPVPEAIATPSVSDLGTATVPGTFPFSIAADVPLSFPAASFGGLTGELRFPIVDSPSADPDKLLASDVRQIFGQAALQSTMTRAAIRRPVGSFARVFIAVVDTGGMILGVFRTPDATLFSFDVSVQKARTVAFFSSDAVLSTPETAGFKALFGLPNTAELAVTTRALGFLSEKLFPPGIAGNGPGPLAGLQSCLGLRPFGNGITIFPGGIPLYKNGKLVGGVGVSGDGVDQDDIISDAGSQGFLPPETVTKCDQLSYGGAHIPYVKFPRDPSGGVGL